MTTIYNDPLSSGELRDVCVVPVSYRRLKYGMLTKRHMASAVIFLAARVFVM